MLLLMPPTVDTAKEPCKERHWWFSSSVSKEFPLSNFRQMNLYNGHHPLPFVTDDLWQTICWSLEVHRSNDPRHLWNADQTFHIKYWNQAAEQLLANKYATNICVLQPRPITAAPEPTPFQQQLPLIFQLRKWSCTIYSINVYICQCCILTFFD